MPCEPNMAAGSILARMRGVGHVFLNGAEIGIEDLSAVEFDVNL